MNFERETAVLPKGVVKVTKAPEQGGKLLQVFLNQDMRNQHNGLTDIAKKNGIDVSKLQPGQYLVFINTAMDRIKMYTADDTFAYQRMKGGQKVDMRAIRHIPKIFQATGKLDYDKALEVTINEYFAHKYPRKAKALVSPLQQARLMHKGSGRA